MLRALALSLLLAAPAAAQDAAGNDTPGNWVATHYQGHGIWNTICDQRPTGDTTEKRCYIRWVDVFSPRPKFAAQFLFVTQDADGPHVAFGIEPGTLFHPDGFRIVDMGGTTWSTRHPGCLTGLACTFSGDQAKLLLAAMTDGTSFQFDFVDRHGVLRHLDWPLTGFAKAFADFAEQRGLRALP